MNTQAELIFTIGIIFFLGLIADTIGKKTSIPRVTFLIIIGIFIGPSGFDFIPDVLTKELFHTIATLALGIIGFLVGQQLTIRALKKSGITVLIVTLGKVFGSFIFVLVLLLFAGLPISTSLLLASISTATAPAAVYEVVQESKINNNFSFTLMSIVALDDILALLMFSLSLTFIDILTYKSMDTILFKAFFEIFGSLLLGFALGYPIAKLTHFIPKGNASLVEALGSVFVICGLSLWFDFSPIISTMALGSSIATFASIHQSRPFYAIKNIRGIVMILFFVLAGASLDISMLPQMSIFGLIYIVARSIGQYIGAKIGAKLSNADEMIEKWMGLALIPQAGVAIGMALIASQHYEEHNQIILSLIVGTTVIFEVFGPFATKYALKKSAKNEA